VPALTIQAKENIMPDTPPLSVKDQKSIQEKLKGNALLASLMMTSPASAFQYLGYDFKTTDFDDVKPPTSEDAALVKKILGILQEGGTILKKPHVIQPAADKALLKPPIPKKKNGRPADITLGVSKATVQYVLEKYTKTSFKGQDFYFPSQNWWGIDVKGESISLDLTQEKAQIVAKLQGKLSFSLWLLGVKLYEWKLEFPIEIGVLAAFFVDEDGLLYLSISKGEISLINAPFPVSLTADLIEKITSMVPYIPLINLPTKFDLPTTSSYSTDEAAVRLSGVSIDDQSISLEFQLEESPRS